ncbi:MAG: radical SAM protein, partial [candidate division Zixibacteria bacterium]|nr:radical SAM protein [candidate division Zixibacteria bacterium]
MPIAKTRKYRFVGVNLQQYKLIDGTHNRFIKQIGDGSIITRFEKTPLPSNLTDVVCPHFLELKWAYGCPFDCSWCYLKGTFRFRPEGIKPVIKDYAKIELHVREFLNSSSPPEILNTGEIADSLMWENGYNPFSKFIIPMFESHDKHKVLFLTKSTNIKHLLEINPHNQVIISFSLNADKVARKWEKKAPAVSKRIDAASRLAEAGYEIRVRIDPMVPMAGWQEGYRELIDQIFATFTPERITLGSLRGLQSTINGTKDKSWIIYLEEKSNWGKKIEFSNRFTMYLHLIKYLKEKYNYTNISLCKETVEMWEKLRSKFECPDLDYKKI